MSNTYQYQPPNGTEGPVTPINGHTLQTGSGLYFVHSTGVNITATENNEISFSPTSNFNVTQQPYGGQVDMAGGWNLAIANSGGFFINDARAGDAHNTFVVGKDVPQLTTILQPTDQVSLQGVTQADINAGFAHAGEGDGYHEVVSINRAGGSPLTLEIPNHFGATAVASQFHPLG